MDFFLLHLYLQILSLFYPKLLLFENDRMDL